MTDTTLTGHSTRVVSEADCASRWGNDGLQVLSTPAILGAMESTCVSVLTPVLAPGQLTVGVSVHMEHLAPTSLGDFVTYAVSITRHGKRFDVEFVVTDSAGTVVSKGRHERAAVDRTAFLDRLRIRRDQVG